MSDLTERLRALGDVRTSALYHQRVILNGAASEIDRLTSELAEAREALDEIAFPISAMRKRAEAEGNKLDGMMANYLSRDPEYLRGIAVSALKEKP